MDTLLGITAKDWWKLLRENRFEIDSTYWSRAAILTVRSVVNSFYKRREDRLYGAALSEVQITEPPIFILGHWRSGTTLLHTLLSLDPRFAYPNLLEVSNPHTFLCIEDKVANRLANSSAEKRPMDNVRVRFDSPAEDEFGISIMSLKSPILGWSFPKREAYYDRFLTFEGVDERTVEEWKSAFLLFLRKLTWRYERQLLLKSPAHTGRIRLLLDLFPEAQIIHVHRNPCAVFQSAQRLYETAVPRSYLQKPDRERLDDGILRRYQMMYDAFFEERALIPAENFLDLAFEELEVDPVRALERIYEHLGLGDFDRLRPRLEEYLAANGDYKKNQYPPLDSRLRDKVAECWRRSFVEWDYPIERLP